MTKIRRFVLSYLFMSMSALAQDASVVIAKCEIVDGFNKGQEISFVAPNEFSGFLNTGIVFPYFNKAVVMDSTSISNLGFKEKVKVEYIHPVNPLIRSVVLFDRNFGKIKNKFEILSVTTNLLSESIVSEAKCKMIKN